MNSDFKRNRTVLDVVKMSNCHSAFITLGTALLLHAKCSHKMGALMEVCVCVCVSEGWQLKQYIYNDVVFISVIIY